MIEKLWLDDVRPPPDDTWVHVRTVEDAKKIFKEHEVKYASLDHDLGYTGPLPGPCEKCKSTGVVGIPDFVGDDEVHTLSQCPACDGDGFIGGDILYTAEHSNEGDGIDLVKWMCETGKIPTEGVRIHSWNPHGASNMYFTLKERFPEINCLVEQYNIGARY